MSAVQDRIRAAFPEYPVSVQRSPEDSATLWVMVFAVPDETVEAVENAIYEAQEALYPNAEYLLLPMVKTVSVTQQYYPERMPKAAVGFVVPILSRFWDAPSARGEWSTLPSAARFTRTEWTPPTPYPSATLEHVVWQPSDLTTKEPVRTWILEAEDAPRIDSHTLLVA